MGFFSYKREKSFSRGFGIIEIVFAVAIITLALFSIIGVASSALVLNRRALSATEASFLIEESIEGLRFMRDKSWSSVSALSPGTSYYLNFSTTTGYGATTDKSMIGIFERTVTVENVYRDGNDDIVPSGTLDPGTLKFTVTVSWWNGAATSSRSTAFYLANIFE